MTPKNECCEKCLPNPNIGFCKHPHWPCHKSIPNNEEIQKATLEYAKEYLPHLVPTADTSDNWQERFEYMERNHGWIPEHKERILAFIAKEKERSREAAIAEVREKIAGMKNKLRMKGAANQYGYNAALSDLLDTLSTLE